MTTIKELRDLEAKLKREGVDSLTAQIASLTADNASASIHVPTLNELSINGVSTALPSKRAIALQVRNDNQDLLLTEEGELVLAFYLAKYREKQRYRLTTVNEFVDKLDDERKRRIERLQVLYRYNLVSKTNLAALMSVTDAAEYQETIKLLKNLAAIDQLDQIAFTQALVHPEKSKLNVLMQDVRKERNYKIYTVPMMVIMALGFITFLFGMFAISFLPIAVATPFVVYGAAAFLGGLFGSFVSLILQNKLPGLFSLFPTGKKVVIDLLTSRDPFSFSSQKKKLKPIDRTDFNIEILKISSESRFDFVELFKKFNITSIKHPLFILFKEKTRNQSMRDLGDIIERNIFFRGRICQDQFTLVLTHVDVFLSRDFNHVCHDIPPHLVNQFEAIVIRTLNNRGASSATEVNNALMRELLHILRPQRAREPANRQAVIYNAQNTHHDSVVHSISDSAAKLKGMFKCDESMYPPVLNEIQKKLAEMRFENSTKSEIVKASFDRLRQLNFRDEKSGVSMQGALALAWSAIHIDKYRGACSLVDAKSHFVNALHDIHTTYGPNGPACARGSFNKLFEALKCIGVEGMDFVVTTKADVTNDYYKAIQNQLQRVFSLYLNADKLNEALKFIQDLEENESLSDDTWLLIRDGVKADMQHHAFFIEKVAKLAGVTNLDQYIDIYREHFEVPAEQLAKFKAQFETKRKQLSNNTQTISAVSMFSSASSSVPQGSHLATEFHPSPL